MKNKESKNMRATSVSRKSYKSKLDTNEGEILTTIGANKRMASQNNRPSSSRGPSKSQIDRLKQFYYTTKLLPNSAFTTYFGKPAFENYGYGNTNPTYGGLFYGNYMLSHNINPMDGGNKPEEKQVYSSAILKTIKRNNVRKPEPPRKVPEEIRNSPVKLKTN
jgi:hypothetical protein